MMTCRKIVLSCLIVADALIASRIDDKIKRDFPDLTVFQKIVGDFNNDGTTDYAVTLWKRSDEKTTVAVYFGDQRDQKDSFRLGVKAPSANCMGCGSMKAIPGEPVGKLSLGPKGTLVTTYVGGSREVWTHVLKWRWDKKEKDFFLIGETYTSVDNFEEEPTQRIDINYLTRKANLSEGAERKECPVPKSLQKSRLSSFNYDEHGVDNQTLILKKCPWPSTNR